MKCFTRETLEVDKADDKVQLTAFKAGLKSREFVVSLVKNPPLMMAKMLLKAPKYMNVEDALATIKGAEKPNERERKEDDRKGRKREWTDRQITNGNKQKDNKTPRMVKFTPLVMLVDIILAQIKDEHYLKWPRPLHLSPNVHDKKKYSCFHKNHSHCTEDCRDLKESIKELIRKRKLQKFVMKGDSSRSKDNNKDKRKASPRDEDHMSYHPQSSIREIKTIIGGSFRSLKKSQQRQVNSIHRIPPLKQRWTDRDILFSEENARGVKQ